MDCQKGKGRSLQNVPGSRGPLGQRRADLRDTYQLVCILCICSANGWIHTKQSGLDNQIAASRSNIYVTDMNTANMNIMTDRKMCLHAVPHVTHSHPGAPCIHSKKCSSAVRCGAPAAGHLIGGNCRIRISCIPQALPACQLACLACPEICALLSIGTQVRCFPATLRGG
jgi:hypothetical protein